MRNAEFTAALRSEQFRVIAFLSSLMIICSEWTISKADREERNPLHYLYDNLTSEMIAKLPEELPAKFFCTDHGTTYRVTLSRKTKLYYIILKYRR